MELLILDTSKYADPLAETWHANPRYTAAFLRRQGIDAAVAFLPVLRAGREPTAARPNALYFEFSDDNISPSVGFLTDWRRSLPDTRFFVGGTTGGEMAEELLARHSEIDGIVIGEPERTLADVVCRLRSQRPLTDVAGLRLRDGDFRPRALIEDLDDLGMMVFDGLAEHFAPTPPAQRTAYLLAGRGCYASCSFCSVPGLHRLSSSGKPWRARSVGLVVDEMEAVGRSFGVRRFVFQDENFFGPGRAGQERAREFAGEILRRDLRVEYFITCRINDVEVETFELLKSSGLTRMGIGVESLNQSSLNLFRKGYRCEAIYPALETIDRLKIACEVNLIFFEPLMDLNDVRRNLDFLDFVADRDWLTYSDSYPFKTLFVAPWSPVAATLAAQGALGEDGVTCRFRDRRVAALADFADRLHTSMPSMFKQRAVLPRGARAHAARGTNAALREAAVLTARLRERLSLVVLPRYMRQAYNAVEEAPEDAASRLSDLETAFTGEMAVLRRLAVRLEGILTDRQEAPT